MKCKLIRPLDVENPEYNPKEHQEALRNKKPYRVKQWKPAEIGHEIDHPDAWKLVANGDAQPTDDECREAAEYYFQTFHKKGLKEGMAIAAHARERLARGILPKHFEDYDAGRMDGYDDAGNATLDGEPVELESDEPEGQTVIVIERDAK